MAGFHERTHRLPGFNIFRCFEVLSGFRRLPGLRNPWKLICSITDAYKKTPLVVLPKAPHYLHRTFSPPCLEFPPSFTSGWARGTVIYWPLSPLLGSPFNELCCPYGSSSQPRLIQAPQDEAQKLASKFDWMEQLLKDSGFDSLGEFLKILFYNPSRVPGQPDPRGMFHAKSVARFLQG